MVLLLIIIFIINCKVEFFKILKCTMSIIKFLLNIYLPK
jgi:hypothetical protein